MNSNDRLKAYLEYAATARRLAAEAACDVARQRHIAIANSWEILVTQERDIQNWPHGPRPRLVT